MRRAALLPLVLVALAGCRAPAPAPAPAAKPDPRPITSPSVAPVDGPVPFHVHLDAGERLSTSSPRAGACPALSTRIIGRDGNVLIAAYGADCPVSGNGSPGNGRHGVYRTSADIPSSRTTTSATTPLGDATLFEQPYYECTNSCQHYTEPVAVIALSAPAGQAIRALVVVAERGSLDLAGLQALVTRRLTP
ncbi:hypothetical protein ACQP2P_30495 [Dactylosporangium sp. CA-139114]|uniref:hypothetical protein n=1 Tax=Dactylosporangium sp. CA-139114 TaxID=3239931 RepID=UPI003D9686A0